MAWGATRLPWPVLLVLLASASWAQETEFVSALEGEAVSVSCRYQRSQHWQVKSCCRPTRLGTCDIVVDSSRTVARQPRFSIRDDGFSGIFTVTMTKLRVKDSGTYWCGIYRPYEISVLKVIRLVVSQGEFFPFSCVRLRHLESQALEPERTLEILSCNPLIKFITLDVAVAVAVLLLLVLTLALILVLYLRKARGRAGKGEPLLLALGGPQSGFAQQMVSGEDTGNICYASLTHLNHCSPEDSIYANTLPNLKPAPDPILSVEYASIARSGPQSSKSATLEEGPGN
uniref:Immunoglobulin domain-containing protein n=1 Tax=Prolemur simus TaxID=1328070 RepID=A0A8C8ZXA6_PROSS